MSHLVVEVAKDLAELDAVAPDWWSLWRRSPGATPFQSPAWLIPWWRAFHPGDLHMVMVRDKGELVGVAPFYIEQGALGRRILPIGISLSDYLDVLLDPASTEAAGRALVTHFEGMSDLWDSWDMEELPPGAAALALPCPDGCENSLAEQSACPVLSLAAGPNGVAGAVPKAKARKLRMARHRLDRRGDAEVARVEADRAGDFLEELFRLHDARWRSRGEAGVLADETVRRFHRDAIDGLLEAGLLRLYLLRAGDQIAGAYYGFFDDRRAYAYLGGFDPAFTFESPGTILVGHAIAEASREGATEFHFLRGREPYKYEWGAEDRWNQRRSFRRRQAVAPHA